MTFDELTKFNTADRLKVQTFAGDVFIATVINVLYKGEDDSVTRDEVDFAVEGEKYFLNMPAEDVQSIEILKRTSGTPLEF